MKGNNSVLLDNHGATPGQPSDNTNPALPKFPNFEGHWFPKQYHSKLVFECYLAAGKNRIDITIWQDRDIYTRFFYVRVGGKQVYSGIIGSQGFDGSVTYVAIASEVYPVELEIYCGSYSEHGWKLVYFWPYFDGAALNVEAEFFPKLYRATLQYQVECGDDTIINMAVQRVNDIYSRYLSIYIDGERKVKTIVGAGIYNFEFDLGDYSEGTIHELKLEIRSGSYVKYGWKVTLCAVHHKSVFVELDYMKAGQGCGGHRPTDTCLQYIMDYYKVHGYERLEIHIDDALDHDSRAITGETFLSDYINRHFDNKDNNRYRYCLFGCHSGEGLGFVYPSEPRCCYIADSDLRTAFPLWHEQARRTILLHEIGHTLGILVLASGERHREIYCDEWPGNVYCAMATSSLWPWGCVMMEPYYCGYHWSIRECPLWSYPTPTLH